MKTHSQPPSRSTGPLDRRIGGGRAVCRPPPPGDSVPTRRLDRHRRRPAAAKKCSVCRPTPPSLPPNPCPPWPRRAFPPPPECPSTAAAIPVAPHPFALTRRAFAFLIRRSQKLRALHGRSFWRFLETTGRFLKKLKILIKGRSEERRKSTGLGARR